MNLNDNELRKNQENVKCHGNSFSPHRHFEKSDLSRIISIRHSGPELEPFRVMNSTESEQRTRNEILLSRPSLAISNVVSNFQCRCPLDLRLISSKTKHVIYKR